MTHIGAGHSGEITGVKISPDGQFIVSVSDDGAIMRWKFPVSNEQTTTPVVPTLNLRVDDMTPRQDTITPGVISPKQEIVSQKMEVGGASSQEPEEMEVGGATPKQEE